MKPTSKGGVYFFAGLGSITAGLGVWQAQRYGWKKDLIAANTVKYEMPISLINDASPDIVTKYEGQRIAFTGYYDHQREVLVGPRTAPTKDTKAQGMATNPQGYFVITPLMLKCGNGATIFVNRGWVPRDAENNTAMSYDRPTWANVTGVVQKPEEKHLFSPENSPASGKLLWLHGKDLLLASRSRAGASGSSQFDDGSQQFNAGGANTATAAREEPIIVEQIVSPASEEEAASKYPVARDAKYADTNYVTPEIHLAYALTWFSLAFAAGVISYMNYKKRKQRIIALLRRQGKL